ncbi:hypothetical protein Tco_0126695 [Tanacetum coccineum]
MAVPKDHLRRSHGMDNCQMRLFLGSIKTDLVESLEKGYDRFQKLLSQLDALGAGVSDEDANHKFLRSLPHAWTKLSSVLATNADDVDCRYMKELDQIDDLDLEEMDINWQALPMTALKIRSSTRRQAVMQEGMENACGFDKRKVECFNCTVLGFARCGMSSTVKIGFGYGIKSNAEVLGYEEEISRGFRDIDDSLYEYGKYGPQPQSPSPTVSDASSTHYSTCQSNDSDGELGTVSDHSVNDCPYPMTIFPIPSIETSLPLPPNISPSQMPKPTQTVDPSCAQHVKSPRQPIRTPVNSSPIPSNNRQNWNQRMERDFGYEDGKGEVLLRANRVFMLMLGKLPPGLGLNANRVNKDNSSSLPRPVN